MGSERNIHLQRMQEEKMAETGRRVCHLVDRHAPRKQVLCEIRTWKMMEDPGFSVDPVQRGKNWEDGSERMNVREKL